MARRGRPTAEVVLSQEERETLERWARRPTSAQALVQRCRIVLAAATGEANGVIAARLGCHPATVGKWRRRFAERSLDGLHDEPRPGKPRSIGDDDVERVIVKTLQETPANATHWSTRSMAAATGMSQSAVSRIWRAFGLKPHQLESFKLSTDPLFIEKVRDIVGLYLNPPEAAVVLCVDEKSQIQALDRTAPILPLLPTTPARATHDYRRHGTTNLYAALDVASRCVISDCTERHRAEEFRRFLNLIDKHDSIGELKRIFKILNDCVFDFNRKMRTIFYIDPFQFMEGFIFPLNHRLGICGGHNQRGFDQSAGIYVPFQ